MRCTEAVVMCVVIGTGRPLCRPVYIIIYALLFLFRSALVSTLATPSALRATVSPRRRCTTLEGAALRGKDFGLARRMLRSHLAPLLGELSALAD